MKKIKTSAVMRAIVADRKVDGARRDCASRVLDAIASRRYVSWLGLYSAVPYSMEHVAGLAPWRGPPHVVHDAIVKLAAHYGIQPTEET